MRRAASWGQPLQLISGPRAARTGLGPTFRSVNSAPLLHAVRPKIIAGGPGPARRDLLALFVHKFAGPAAPRPARIAFRDQLSLFGAYGSRRWWRRPSAAGPRRRDRGRGIWQPPTTVQPIVTAGRCCPTHLPRTEHPLQSAPSFPELTLGSPALSKSQPIRPRVRQARPGVSVSAFPAGRPGLRHRASVGLVAPHLGCHQPGSQLTGVVWGPSAARAGTRFAAMGVPRPVTGSQPGLAL